MSDGHGEKLTRDEFLRRFGRGAGVFLLGGLAGGLGARKARGGTVWQIDPAKCTQCGRCATHCVLDQSAVKCFHSFPMCGYCDLCTGFFEPEPIELFEGAENQLCPMGAIVRRFVEDPYFEYQIDESLCIGCGVCVKGCTQFGNGSLYLQINHGLCDNCNECAIARACPSKAIVRIPASHPYIPRLQEE
ncbi:MAG: 4Fe-4S dicluster domain protein [candidate division BRC1 bacterium ADurb.BinA364]|nr:MAG: 4Fe-4S dicluster domain protein [candidate division BRC1 bacterium ADurb.BinA364]